MTEVRLPLLAGLMGWPVHQSKSPLIHEHWLKHLNIDGAYVRFPVKPGDVEAALRSMSALGLVGMQATMPHKRACFEAVDELSPAARALGAVNTVTVQADGSLCGHNTDLAGFLEPLRDIDLSGQSVTILGAGGAAAALVVGLASKKPARITIINRSVGGIERLLKDVGGALDGIEIRTGGWDQVHALIQDSGLLANATSLGMVGQPPLLFDIGSLPPSALVYDIITHPHETDLLKSARRRGHVTIDGMQMLIGQAREAFELFYGQSAPPSEDGRVRDLLLS
jgi:shikimate dehydrogenase